MNRSGPWAAWSGATPHPSRSQAGFSLVEITITLAVVSLVLLGLIGLLGVGVANNQTSSEQTTATNIIATLLADLRSTPTNYTSAAVSTTRFNIPLSTVNPPSNASSPPLTGVTPVYIYFDSYENPLNAAPYTSIPAAVPPNSAYLASIYLVKMATGPNATPSTAVPAAPQNTFLLRCVVTWPAQTLNPTGNVDVVTEFQGH